MSSKTLPLRNLTAIYLIPLLFLSAAALQATDRSWDAGDGAFQTAGNWGPAGVPGASDNIFLVRAAPVTITSSTDEATGQLAVGNQTGGSDDEGDFTLDLGTSTLTSGTAFLYGIDYTAFTAGGTKSLTVLSGTLATSNVRLGASLQTGVTTDLIVTGTGTVFNTNGRTGFIATSNYNQVGTNGAGRAYVQSGGVWNVTNSSTEIGSGASSNSLLQVTGAGSAFNGSSSNSGNERLVFFAATSGTGTVEVLDGATLSSDDFNVGRFAGALGTVTVSGTGSSLTSKRLFVGGGVNTGSGSPVEGGTGVLTVASGGSTTVSESMVVFSAGTVDFTGGTLATTGSALLSIKGGSVTGSGTIGGTGGVAIDTTSGGSLNASGGALTISSGLTVGQVGGFDVIGILTGTVNVTGTTWVRANHTLQVDGTLGGAGDITLDGALAGTGTINKAVLSQGNNLSSAGILTLGSTYTIGTNFVSTISTGTVAANGLTSFTSGSRTLTVNGTLGGSGDLNLTNGTINGSGQIRKTGGTISGSGTVGGSVTTTLSNGAISGGNFTNAVTIDGNVTLGTMVASSTLTVNGAGNTVGIAANTSVAGTTLISGGGELTVSGTLGGTGGLTVIGTLSGNGRVDKAVTVAANGTLSPGNSPGNPSYSSLIYEAGGNYNWQVVDATGAAGTGFDTISVTGVLDLTGLLTTTKFDINLWSLSSTGPDVNGNAANFDNALSQSWTLVDAGSVDTTGLVGSLSDYFNVNVSAANGTGGFSNNLGGGSFSVSVNGNALQLDFTPVPEPSTALLVGLSLMVVVLGRKRGVRRI